MVYDAERFQAGHPIGKGQYLTFSPNSRFLVGFWGESNLRVWDLQSILDQRPESSDSAATIDWSKLTCKDILGPSPIVSGQLPTSFIDPFRPNVYPH